MLLSALVAAAASAASVSALPVALAFAQVQRVPESGAAKIRYEIEARLDEETDLLHGRARLHYWNDSPDTLRDLYFHLYLNAFRPHSLWARTERRT
ncbi:MAG: hypothetical protein ACREKI_09900, partial [Gemmatimonadota bacterium]